MAGHDRTPRVRRRTGRGRRAIAIAAQLLVELS
jgi:hypothetical protein